MAITRADKFTQVQRKEEFFSDFLNNFDKVPITNVLSRVTNENSVTQSLRNLILTDLGERVFEPRIGSTIKKAMFEQNDVITAERLMNSIKNTIKNNEPRVNLIDVLVSPSPEDHSFNVSILYYVINNPNPSKFQIVLKRVR